MDTRKASLESAKQRRNFVEAHTMKLEEEQSTQRAKHIRKQVPVVDQFGNMQKTPNSAALPPRRIQSAYNQHYLRQ